MELSKVAFDAHQIDYKKNVFIKYSNKEPPKVSSPKHGQVDEKNEAHVGGNTWMGGSGGSDTAGLGGRGGPYRLDSGNEIHQLSDELKSQVPQDILDASRAMGQEALKKRLNEIKMSENEASLFTDMSNQIEAQTKQLKVLLESVGSKEKERIWIRNQSDGELDDSKLVEGITGERSVYKKRGKNESSYHFPKRVKFVFDVSGSMYRFNSFDQRLTKSLETALMLMQSFATLQDKYVYDIVGHSGDSVCIDFVQAGKPPKNEKEMLKILMQMLAHSQYCWSGDNTLAATSFAIQEIVKEHANDYFVIVISDANLNRYGIHPNTLGRILEQDPQVHAVLLFIGSLGDEAKLLTKQLPRGKSFYVPDTHQIPQFCKAIFEAIS